MNKEINIFLIIMLTCSILSAKSLSAGTVVIPSEDKNYYPLRVYLEYYEDKTGNLSVNDINQIKNSFRSGNFSSLNLGFTSSAYWIIFSITNPLSNDMELFIKNQYPPLSRIDLFIPDPYGGFKQIKGGYSVPFNSRLIKNRNAIFPINQKAGSTTQYIMRFETESSFKVSLQLHTAVSLFENINNEQTALGLYYGIILLIIISNLVFYLYSREKIYLIYIFYIFSYGLYQLGMNGMANEFLPFNKLFPEYYNHAFFMGLIGLSMLLFTMKLFDTERNMIYIDKYLKLLCIFSFLIIPASLLIDYSIIIHYVITCVLIVTISMIAVSIYSLVKRIKGSLYYFIAWIFTLSGNIVQALSVAAVIPDNFFTRESQQTGSALNMIFLSFSIGDMMRIMKKEKEEAQNSVLLLQQNYSKSLEKTVQERTSELEIEKSKLTLKNAILENEVALAKKIQYQLIPGPAPTDYIYSLYRPMQDVGGDLYDFIKFRDSRKLGIFISDVSGHGVPAAFITSMIKTTILQSGNRKENPAELMFYINDILQDLTAGNFITAFYGVYDPDEKSILYTNAGHPLPYIINNNGINQLTGGRSIALSIFPNSYLIENNKTFRNFEEKISAGSKLLFYTDGLTEACPVDSNIPFERDIMKDVFIMNRDNSSELFIHNLYQSLISFRGTDSFEDDVCMVCLDVI